VFAAKPWRRRTRGEALAGPDAGDVRTVQQWRERFQQKLTDVRGRLGAGRLVAGEPVPDGPFVEVKELIGGYMIVSAESIDEAHRSGARVSRARASRVGCRGDRSPRAVSASHLAEHFFRHEYGRLVAILSRRIGVQHLAAIEDAAQSALLTAVELWTANGIPENPSAWLFRVAHHHVVGELRRQARRDRLLELGAASLQEVAGSLHEPALAGDVGDELLRMLFVCCDDGSPVESQLVLALKTLCGFGVGEIAQRLFITEANVYKRLGRARQRLREDPNLLDELTNEQLALRLPAVHAIIYLLFTQGYLSSRADAAIEKELCDEAKRLALVLVEHPVGRTPETFALLSLLHLHSARLAAREDGAGDLLLLEEQDRSFGDQLEIQTGLSWLARSADGDVFSRYHAEAGIAAEHCLAPSFSETRWDRIVECYELLSRLAPSAIHTLNRAVATAELRGPEAGLRVVRDIEPPSWLEGAYLWAAVLADLHRRCGHLALARQYGQEALEGAPSGAVKNLLGRRLSETVRDATRAWAPGAVGGRAGRERRARAGAHRNPIPGSPRHGGVTARRGLG
jgi:RNA polymerase sigma factor (sigma-70 family)